LSKSTRFNVGLAVTVAVPVIGGFIAGPVGFFLAIAAEVIVLFVAIAREAYLDS
jgi:hypothetical protein